MVRDRRARRSDCPVHFALRHFGDAWTLLLVRDMLLFGKSTYSEFLASDEGIATNVLADRLARLEADGLVRREVEEDRPGRPRYRLTGKGLALLPVMLEMIAWSAEHDADSIVAPAFLEAIRTDRAAVEREIRAAYDRGQPWEPPTTRPSTPRSGAAPG